MRKLFWLIIAGLILYPLFTTTALVVDQREYAIVYTMGEVKQIITEPGLYFKLPAPLQQAVLLDRRLVTTESPQPVVVTTSEKKNIQVDSLVTWRITDPRQHFISFEGYEQKAHDKINLIAKKALNDELTKLAAQDVISGDRTKLIESVRKQIADEAKLIGVEVVDVRFKRVDFDEKITAAIYEKMKTELAKVANETRSTGTADAERIRADADKQRTVIVAEAYRDAQKIRGDGDARAMKIYAQAFGQNPEFAKFYRTLEAYRASFNSRSDVIVVDPSSEFFRYMKNPKPAGGK